MNEILLTLNDKEVTLDEAIKQKQAVVIEGIIHIMVDNPIEFNLPKNMNLDMSNVLMINEGSDVQLSITQDREQPLVFIIENLGKLIAFNDSDNIFFKVKQDESKMFSLESIDQLYEAAAAGEEISQIAEFTPSINENEISIEEVLVENSILNNNSNNNPFREFIDVNHIDYISDKDLNLIKGIVTDGYIKLATVFIDTNSNNRLDAGEPSTVSDENGNFSLENPNNVKGVLTAIGGKDISTGLDFEGTYTAPENSTVISPLTTVLEKLVANENLSIEEAKVKLSAVFNLPDVNLQTFDPFKEVENSHLDAIKVQAVAIQVANTINQISAMIDGEDGQSNTQEERAASLEVAAFIAEQTNENSDFDLTQKDDMDTILNEFKNNNITDEEFEAISQAITSINELIEDTADNSNGSGLEILGELAQIQTEAEAIEELIENLGDDENNSEELEDLKELTPPSKITINLLDLGEHFSVLNPENIKAYLFKTKEEVGEVSVYKNTISFDIKDSFEEVENQRVIFRYKLVDDNGIKTSRINTLLKITQLDDEPNIEVLRTTKSVNLKGNKEDNIFEYTDSEYINQLKGYGGEDTFVYSEEVNIIKGHGSKGDKILFTQDYDNDEIEGNVVSINLDEILDTTDIRHMEKIELSQNQNLINLTHDDIESMTNKNHAFYIDGDETNRVILNDEIFTNDDDEFDDDEFDDEKNIEWERVLEEDTSSQKTENGYNVFSNINNSSIKLLIDTDIIVEI